MYKLTLCHRLIIVLIKLEDEGGGGARGMFH